MMKKKFWPYIFLLCCCWSCSSFISSPTHSSSQHTQLQGTYEYCAPHIGQQCLDRLRQIASLGVSIVVNYQQFSGSMAQILAYAQEAEKDHLKILWNFSDLSFLSDTATVPYIQLLHECQSVEQCNNRSFITYIVDHVKHLSSTYGYYIGDEVSEKLHTAVRQLSYDIHESDAVHPTVLVETSAQKALAFVDVASIVLVDYYPIGTPKESIKDIADIAQALHQHQFGFVLQAHSLYQYADPDYPQCVSQDVCPYPTVDQMKQMKKNASSAATLLLWYSYFNMLNADHPQMRLKNLSQAIQ